MDAVSIRGRYVLDVGVYVGCTCVWDVGMYVICIGCRYVCSMYWM